VLNKAWTETDVAYSDSDSECSRMQKTKIKYKDSEGEKIEIKQFILVPPKTHE